MTNTPAAETSRQTNESVPILDLPEALTGESEATLLAAARDVGKGKPPALILNGSNLRMMDAAGLGELMTLVALARRRGQALLAYGLSERMTRVFALTRLDEAVGLYATEPEALAASSAPQTLPTPLAQQIAATPLADTNWAPPQPRLQTPPLPTQAVNINVNGRRVLGPLDGFGPLMRKTYSIRLDGAAVTPEQVIKVWKEQFTSFWPKGNSYYSAPGAIAAGAVGVLNLTLMGPLKLHTGVLVIYADDTSFCFMTPEGHMFGGLITFSAHADNGVTVAQVQPLIRASDPFYDLTLRTGVGSSIEDKFWAQSLRNLAAHFGVQAKASLETAVLERGVQWSKAGNIWYNAAIRSTFYSLAAPLRWLGRRISRPKA